MPTRTKVTIQIAGPVIMNGLARYSTLDALLAWVAVERMKDSKNRNYTQADCDDAINYLPIKKINVKDGYIYCCSIPQYENIQNYAGMKSRYSADTDNQVVLHKMINATRLCKYMPADYVIQKIGDNRLGRSGGPWKTAMPTFYPHLATDISWIFEGDRDAVADLLTDITHIGKKTAIGYGRVLGITFEDTDTSIQRLLPVSDYDVEPMFFARLIPPFWASTEKVLMGLGQL